jgi:hypothetical protein
MGMQAQGQQGQVYYDNSTGQYYTQPSQAQFNPTSSVFNMMPQQSKLRNYLSNFNNQSMIPTEPAKYNYVDIAALFPEMYQGAQGMQGDYQAGNLLGGAAQAASSGAGRFL